jgi:hypothetical protein
MRGPPITVTCDCGESRDLKYGERWECQKCGRRWNTEQIPREEYTGLMRDLRRYRLEMVGAALALVAAFLPLVLFVNRGLFLILPVILALSAIFYGPAWKRRVRRRIAERPRWELHPD